MVDQNESAEQQRKSSLWSYMVEQGSRRGVRGVRKPQNCTEIRQKAANCIGFFSRIPKLHVHGGPL